jgi:SMI1/KNR4 family protein SUKH-1
VLQEGGFRFRGVCTFGGPASQQAIDAASAQLGLALPLMYERFLSQYDGALLYRDEMFGQWGFRLYGTGDLVSANARWKQRYNQEWPPSYVAFAESLGDGDLLILDIAQPNKQGTDCRVIDGDSGYQPREWKAAARTFSDWLDRLVVAQGTKYWRWS